MRKMGWGGKLLLAFSLVLAIAGLSVESKPAFAAGEVLSVSSDVVEHGVPITLTVTNIVASSFCDYLPYAGEGYYAEAYIMNLSNDFYWFPPQSSRFDPRVDDSVTLEVVLPSSYPVGMAAITVDCMYPDGRQTGNTAKPRTVEVVSQGSSPSSRTTGPEEGTDARLNEPPIQGESDQQATQLGVEGAVALFSPLPRIAIVVEETDATEPQNVLVLDGNQIETDQEIEVRLEGVSSNYAAEIHAFTTSQPNFREILFLPADLRDGSYRLVVEAESLGGRENVRGELRLLVEESRYLLNDGSEIRPPEGQSSLLWWILLCGSAVALLGLLLMLTLSGQKPTRPA